MKRYSRRGPRHPRHPHHSCPPNPPENPCQPEPPCHPEPPCPPRPPYCYPYNPNYLPPLRDYGDRPFVINIEKATKKNDYYRLALWTGDYLQLTLMSIMPGDDIGLEVHPDVDQFIRIEQGEGIVMMGNNRNNLTYCREVRDDDAIIIPAGTWHNLINTGKEPMKLYSIYAPPEHPFGTVHKTKADDEHHH